MLTRFILPGRSPAGRFARAEDGNVAMLFGLSLSALLVCSGLALDMGAALEARTKMSLAIDSAALSAAKAARIYNMNQKQTQDFAENYLKTNLKNLGNDFASIDKLDVKVPGDVSEVKIEVLATYRTRFGGIINVNTYQIGATGAAQIKGYDVEVGMQLDVTGSMNEMQGGMRKIDALKSSAKKAIDILIPDNKGPQKIRVGYAPFTEGVNAGKYAGAVSNFTSIKCVYERKNLAIQASDIAPSGLNSLSAGTKCPGSPVMPMTDDKSALKAGIDGLVLGGSTAGHLGAAWSWYLLSPDWTSVFGGQSPAPYNDGNTLKFSIMMTDGIYNTFAGSSNGDNGSTAAQSAKYASDTCTAMKTKGIKIYTIGFGDAIVGAARTTLEKCASDQTKFFLALNQADLDAAFEAIARDITALRLTR